MQRFFRELPVGVRQQGAQWEWTYKGLRKGAFAADSSASRIPSCAEAFSKTGRQPDRYQQASSDRMRYGEDAGQASNRVVPQEQTLLSQ